MRIGSFTQIQQVYATQQSAKVSKKEQKKGFSDAISISGAGKDMQTAKSALAATPDVRPEVVSAFKAKINAGTYDVSSDSFADMLMEKMQQGSLAL